MLQDPEFLAAIERARSEINDKLKTELCRHNQRAFDDEGHPTPCPECRSAGQNRSTGFWSRAKTYMDGVKPLEEEEASARKTQFVDTPGFPEPEQKS
ncbi:MAG: hypothetical protein ACT4OM_13310 [Actinomycetota bacterium]